MILALIVYRKNILYCHVCEGPIGNLPLGSV